ncbi:hypothetical protein LCGC14_0624690 [marine sediment metagenome]|uniref:Uncharacterized protein n=1 Tax=marine sediment metagenome TaxID=412755 RepID=A0A0F9R8S6_9ZZZZ
MSLDLDALLNEGKKIYVKNTSRPMGHIVLTFVTAHGKAVPRNIPRTWIPICLTDTLSPDIIAQSNELRQFLNKGILALVEPTVAQNELKTADASEESRRLNLSDFSDKAEVTERTLVLDNQFTAEANPLNPMEPAQLADPVNNRVKSTLLRVESKDITEREAVAEFRIMQGELTSHDLTYIISQVEDEGPLKRFSFAVLSEHSAAVAQDVVDTDDPAEDPEALAAGRSQQAV